VPPVVSKKVAVPEVGEAVAATEVVAAVVEAAPEVVAQAPEVKADEVPTDAPEKE
jgi:hypothetical protein